MQVLYNYKSLTSKILEIFDKRNTVKKITVAMLISVIALYATPAAEELSTWKNVKVIEDLIKASHRIIGEITPLELMNKVEEMDDFILVDIREPGQRGHGDIYAESAIDIIRGYLEFKIENIIKDKNTPLIIYCCSGKRSILASHTLLEMGYKNVRSLQGGVQGWLKAGLPLSTHYGEMIKKPDNYTIQKK